MLAVHKLHQVPINYAQWHDSSGVSVYDAHRRPILTGVFKYELITPKLHVPQVVAESVGRNERVHVPTHELTDEEVGRRIREARLRAGYASGVAFARATGLSQPTVSRIESGRRSVSVPELARIAAVLDRPAEVFLQPGRGSDAFFRLAEHTDLGEGVEPAVRWLEKFAYRLQALRDFTPGTDLPRPVDLAYPEPRSWEDAKTIAMDVRTRLRLGSAPAPDMIQLLEDAGCLVVVRPLGKSGPDAVYVPAPLSAVLLNGDRPRVRQRFTCAHELGHHLFHGTYVTVDSHILAGHESRAEQLCNIFAANFLMPEEGVSTELQARFDTQAPEGAPQAYWLAMKFGVSVEAMCYQLANMHLVPRDRVSAWRENLKRQDKKALAYALGLIDWSQRPPVEKRWPPELMQRLRGAHEAKLLDRAQLRKHLDNDNEAVQALLS